MYFYQFLIYGSALVLIIVGLIKRSNHLKARHVRGNVVVGNNFGTVNQTSKDLNYENFDRERMSVHTKPDFVAWAIGILGVLIAGCQLAFDLYK